jgi:hypothetical protein
MNEFIKHFERKNIIISKLEKKEKYLWDIQEIKDSFSGHSGAIGIINSFILESAQLLTNAVFLFEKGYFDAAFYSLRSAIELSTTFVYLYDMPDYLKKQNLMAWKAENDFPMQGHMLKKLIVNGKNFKDMRDKMSVFFDAAEKNKKALQKYVHKQGLRHFYVARSSLKNDFFVKYMKQFEYFLQKAIGIVAVMRLAVDPFPILLMDKEVIYRCFDSITEPYTEDFVNKYINPETIEAYKQTTLYQSHANELLANERKEQATFDVTNNRYINLDEIDTIFAQRRLLSWSDRCAVTLVFTYPQASKIYFSGDSYSPYFTPIKSNRKDLSYSSVNFDNFAKAKHKLNQLYGEAFISVFRIGSEYCFIEHNNQLTANDIVSLSRTVVIINEKGIIDNDEN